MADQNSISRVQDQSVPLQIDWANSGGTGVVSPTINVNLGQQLSQSPWGTLQSMYIDNVNCNISIAVIFPDTNSRLVVPAGGTLLWPVNSISNNFYVVPQGDPGSTDFTDITCYNFFLPPAGLPQTEPNEGVVTSPGISLGGSGTTAIIPNPTNGVIEGINISFSGGLGNAVAPGTTALWQVQDGNGDVIANGEVFAPDGTYVQPMILFTQTGMNVEFLNGIFAVVTNTGGAFVQAGNLYVNIFYRT
jgi:hypothetical protein